MINLPNNCRCCSLSVYPKNWKTKNAKTSIERHIAYRFHDSRFSKQSCICVVNKKGFASLIKSCMHKYFKKITNPTFLKLYLSSRI